MMKNSFKSVFTGFSDEFAGEYLSVLDKSKILNHDYSQNGYTNSLKNKVDGSIVVEHKKSRIALLCDDSTNKNVLSYILENANHCDVDILYHGQHKKTVTESFYKQARSSFIENNVDVTLVSLINESIEEIVNYLMTQRALQFLVTDSHDSLMSKFLKNKLINREVNVPIVLIN